MGLSIRHMTRADLDVVLDWAAAEGWNPGIYDAECFFVTDPSGFFLAELNGEPIGSVSAVAYDGHFGFMGLYIVRREFRGRRIGLELAKAGQAYLGNRTIGVDGVASREANYHTWGFRTSYRTMRYEGICSGAHSDICDTPIEVAELSALPLPTVAAYDARIFPAPRPQFLHAWISQPGARCVGLIQQDRLVGYGVSRLCRAGCKIGPLAADDQYLAEILFQELTAAHPGSLVYLDVPETNELAVTLAQRHGMQPVFETVRMYLGSAPEIAMDRVYGITTLELG